MKEQIEILMTRVKRVKYVYENGAPDLIKKNELELIKKLCDEMLSELELRKEEKNDER